MSQLSMSKQEREEFLAALHVTVEGPVEVEQTDRATRVDIATRYLGTDLGTQYVDGSPDADDLVFRLRPTRWRTSDFSKLDLAAE